MDCVQAMYLTNASKLRERKVVLHLARSYWLVYPRFIVRSFVQLFPIKVILSIQALNMFSLQYDPIIRKSYEVTGIYRSVFCNIVLFGAAVVLRCLCFNAICCWEL